MDRNVGQLTGSDPSADVVREVMASFHLVDGYRSVHPKKPGHTWFRANSVQSSRIDRVYVSRDMRITHAETVSLPFSDHNPVYLDLELICSNRRSNRSGGVVIAIKDRFRCEIPDIRKDTSGRCISVLYTTADTSFRVCNIYAPNSPSERKMFFNELYVHTRGSNPIILGGDFNCVIDPIDRSSTNANTHSFAGRDEIQDLASQYNLVDCYRTLHPSTPGHTWARRDRSSRLDRLYLPTNFAVTKVDTVFLPFSDHNPVYVNFSLNNSPRKGKGYWKYNSSLSHDEDFVHDLRYQFRLWSTLKPPFCSITDWWENVKSRIKELAIRHGIRIAQKKRHRIEKLQKVLSDANSGEIERILNAEVHGAFIRSRPNYLEEGEKLSAFFFRKEKYRAEQKLIRSIRNTDGSIVYENKEIMSVFHHFFSQLFSEQCGCNEFIQDEFVKCLSTSLSKDDKNSLDHPITLDEVQNAIRLAAKNKAPGSDGLSYDFYASFTDLLSTDLTLVFNEIFCKGSLSKSQRTGVVTLLPKNGDSLDPTNWRPLV
ncbi:hypothetical protein HOLleu_21822 [Holothuria leucospilota]|uniref:Endonuclease/exonuclease/phosphatase domain-containing protein n=1 Tax=Holothuria leucospilota TaxID=206669 RepID=A0A9Q1BYA1_HOLLE|nr:hypothetical protein HOLleu_21822 [Holothuria leucospilota]